jgi:hypothetical protein
MAGAKVVRLCIACVVPTLAITCEGIGLDRFWPGTLAEIVTYPVIPQRIIVDGAIVASIVTALVSCVFLLRVIPARWQSEPGQAAKWAVRGTVGLLASYLLGKVVTWDIARVCPDVLYGTYGAFGLVGKPTAVAAACSAYHDTVETAQPWGRFFLTLAVILAGGVALRNLVRARRQTA